MVAFLSVRRKAIQLCAAVLAMSALAACDVPGVGGGPLINTTRAVPVALLVPKSSPSAAGVAQSLENAARLAANDLQGAEGRHRHRRDDLAEVHRAVHALDDGDLRFGATETPNTWYTPGTSLAEGLRTLYVQGRDAAHRVAHAVDVGQDWPFAPVKKERLPTHSAKSAHG